MKAVKVFFIIVLFVLTSAQLLHAEWSEEEKSILKKIEKAPHLADKGGPSNCVKGFVNAMCNKDFKTAAAFGAKKFKSELSKEIKNFSSYDSAEKMQYIGIWKSLSVKKEYWPKPEKRGYALVEADVKVRRRNKKILFTVEKNGTRWYITEIFIK